MLLKLSLSDCFCSIKALHTKLYAQSLYTMLYKQSIIQTKSEQSKSIYKYTASGQDERGKED